MRVSEIRVNWIRVNQGLGAGDCDTDMLKIFVKLMKNYYLKDVVDMTLSDEYKTDDILFSYWNYMMDLCFSFEIMALFAGFRLRTIFFLFHSYQH